MKIITTSTFLNKRLLYNTALNESERYLVGSAGSLEVDGQQLKKAPTAAENAEIIHQTEQSLEAVNAAISKTGSAAEGVYESMREHLQEDGVAGLLEAIQTTQEALNKIKAQDSTAEHKEKTARHEGKKEAQKAAENAVQQVEARKNAATALILQLITDAKRIKTQEEENKGRSMFVGKGIEVEGLFTSSRKKRKQSAEDQTPGTSSQLERAKQTEALLIQDALDRHTSATSALQQHLSILKMMTGWDDATLTALQALEGEALDQEVQKLLSKDDAPEGHLAHDIHRLQQEKARLEGEMAALEAEIKCIEAKKNTNAENTKQQEGALKELEKRLAAVAQKMTGLADVITSMRPLQEQITAVQNEVERVLQPVKVIALSDGIIEGLWTTGPQEVNAELCDGLQGAFEKIFTAINDKAKAYFGDTPPQPEGFDKAVEAFKKALADRKAAKMTVEAVRTNPLNAVATYFGTNTAPAGVFAALHEQGAALLKSYTDTLAEKVSDETARSAIQANFIAGPLSQFNNGKTFISGEIQEIQQEFQESLFNTPQSHPSAVSSSQRCTPEREQTLSTTTNNLNNTFITKVLFPVLSVVLKKAELQTLKDLQVGQNATLVVDLFGRTEQRFTFSLREENNTTSYQINGVDASELLMEEQDGLIRILRDVVTSLQAGEAKDLQWEWSVQAS